MAAKKSRAVGSVKKAKTWVKETVLGVAGTILTATVLGMLGFNSGTPTAGNTAGPNAAASPQVQFQNQAQAQLASAIEKYAGKAKDKVFEVANEKLAAVAKEKGISLPENADSSQAEIVRPTSFSTGTDYGSSTGSSIPDARDYRQAPVDPIYQIADNGTGRYGESTAPTSPMSGSSNGISNPGTTSGGGFPSNTAATVAAVGKAPATNGAGNVQQTAGQATNTPAANAAGAGAKPGAGIVGQWEQLVYNPDDGKWYSGGIYRVTQRQDGYGIDFLDTTQIEPKFIPIAGIKELQYNNGEWSFESHLEVGEVLLFKLRQVDEETYQGHCYQDGVQLAANAWRRVKTQTLNPK